MIYVAICCLTLLLYSYVGFPLLTIILAKLIPRKSNLDADYQSSISIILPAHNEEVVLRRCLLSLIELDYPRDQVQILVGSDGSTDRTNSILSEIAQQYPIVKPFYFLQQRGKMAVLNDLVDAARNQVLLFVDADITLNKNAIRAHIRHYSDPEVGGVAGELRFAGAEAKGVFEAEASYWDFETRLRSSEGIIASTLGLYGGNYSMRRSCWRPIPPKANDDFFAVLNLLDQHKRIVYEHDAYATELYGRTHSDEYSRKRRNAYFSLNAISYFPYLLVRPSSAWMLWPHKVLRWESGLLTILLFLSTLGGYINRETWAAPLIVLEILYVLLVVSGYISERLHKPLPIATQAFWLTNIQRAGIAGTIAFLFSSKDTPWYQTARVSDDLASMETEIREVAP
jgi:biofilm PGA synthesis N-glycosyltransferase PgaC